MEKEAISKNSPLVLRIAAWFSERFPPANWILLSFIYSTALLFGHLIRSDGILQISILDILGVLPAIGFFLMLRVFDEHKDYELDCELHPERVLQRGLITLNHLKVIGALSIFVQAGFSLLLDGGFGAVTAMWAITFGWSLLMAKEFFCRSWLNRHMLLYALSHMVVTPMSMLWMAQMGAAPVLVSANVAWLAALSFASGAAFELTRKTRGPEEEREGLDSYTKTIGVVGAPLAILFFVLTSVALEIAVLKQVISEPAWYWFFVVICLALLPVGSVSAFLARPSAKARKANEAAVGLFMMASYLVLLAAMIADRGIAWL
jgi:4-hydroxybenzoate polyprenyltransferase